MPENLNEFHVERKEYFQLVSENQDRVNRIEQIRETANSICSRRIGLAQCLKERVQKIHEDRISIKDVISNIMSNLGIVQDANTLSDIRTLCSNIESDLDEYERSAKELSNRFENKKIKISSIGYRSQGKSNFTCLYSGLPENVVAVKGPIDEEDKTGAINIIHHMSGISSSNPVIKVTFKSKEEVLARVNEYLAQWPEPINGKTHLSSYGEFLNLKNNVTVCNAINHYTGHFDTSIKKGLLGFFGSDIDLSEVGHEQTTINVGKLSKYNDIQYNGEDRKSYSAVDHIDIYVDLGNNDLFENFEICDTKGSSTDVGGLVADKDIFSSIDSSDAAFTIIRVGQGQKGSEFITNVLYPHYKDNIDLINNKHFVIINVDERCGQVQTVDNACSHIMGNKIAQAIYVGSFRERPIKIDYARDSNGLPSNPNEPKIVPPLFVDGVLLDMLARIAESTNTNDIKLISIVNNKSVTINENIQNLKNIFLQLPELKEKSEDGLIIEVIKNLRDATYNQINSNINSNQENTCTNNPSTNNSARRSGINFSQNSKVEQVNTLVKDSEVSYSVEQPSLIDYEEQYKKLRGDKFSIFKLLTGDDRSSRGKERQSVKDEIDESVRYLYTNNNQPRPSVSDLITDTIESHPCGNTSDSGRFIECVSMMFSNKIKDNFNKKLIPQGEILFKEEADELFKIIWDGLKLNCFNGWGEYSHDKLAEKASLNPQLKDLFDLYTDAYEATTDPISLFTPYDTLLSYFRRFFEREDKSKHYKETDIVIDDEILIKTLIDLIRAHNIPKMIVDKATDKQRRVNNLRIQIIQEIAPQTQFVQKILPLYRLPEANPVFSSELRERREQNEKVRNFNSAKNSVVIMKNVTSISIPTENGTTQN